jgi:3-hydroxybutyryl-CoA dehydrogenase
MSVVDSTATGADDIRRVGVVGCGLMGSGIAEVCARAGLRVRVAEVTEQAAKAGRERLLASLDRAARRGKLAEADRDAALERLSFGHELAALADSDLVIEAVAEDERMKTEVFGTLDKVVERPDAILATNTSSIPVTRLGMATARPGQVIGIHFFNPVPVLRLVEIVPSLRTDAVVVERAESFATTVLGKQVVKARDRAGFIVNALLIPYLLSAIRMVESNLATAEDIDNGMVLGCAHPMGPLRLADLIGLDTTLAIAESLYAEFKEPQYAAPPLLSRLVDAGLLGKKSGRGFYDYSE